jgi:hypothetical protein
MKLLARVGVSRMGSQIWLLRVKRRNEAQPTQYRSLPGHSLILTALTGTLTRLGVAISANFRQITYPSHPIPSHPVGRGSSSLAASGPPSSNPILPFHRGYFCPPHFPPKASPNGMADWNFCSGGASKWVLSLQSTLYFRFYSNTAQKHL